MARFTLTLTDTQEQILKQLMELCDLKKGEVLADGLMLLSWAAVEANQGLSIAAIDEKRRIYKEVKTPALLAAGRTVSRTQADDADDEQPLRGIGLTR